MSLATGAYNLLVTQVATLSGVTATNMARVTALNSLTIEERIRNANLTIPFIIFLMEQDVEGEFGLNTRASVTPIDIGYFTEQSTADQMDVLETMAETLKNGLYGFQGSSGSDTCQILELPVKNVDLSNRFNQICLGIQNGLIAVSVRCKVLYGDIV